ncbi:MAG: phosphatase [Armatimonadetes bacterium]|nr:phosphatase [Armatimonadota bacterium]
MSDEEIMERLTWLRICGPEGAHTRQNNLESIGRLKSGDPYVTLRIRAVENAMREDPGWTPRGVLDAVASVTGCSKDPRHTVGQGYISPRATLRGLRACAERVRAAAERGGNILFATGHAGCLIACYQEIADSARELGATLIHTAGGWEIEPWEFIDWVGDVCVVSNGSGLLHTHTARAMEEILSDWGADISLAVTDHGFLGPALNRGIPAVAFFDTNDPAPAVARCLGLDVTLVPLNDNRPNAVLREAGLVVREALAAPVAVP